MRFTPADLRQDHLSGLGPSFLLRQWNSRRLSHFSSLFLYVSLMSIYLHVGPFSRKVMASIDRQIADADMTPMPNTRVPMHLERAALSA